MFLQRGSCRLYFLATWFVSSFIFGNVVVRVRRRSLLIFGNVVRVSSLINFGNVVRVVFNFWQRGSCRVLFFCNVVRVVFNFWQRGLCRL